jgi:hypothetical protein
MGGLSTIPNSMLNIVEWLDNVSSLGPLMSQKPSFLKQPAVNAPLYSSLGYLTPVEFEYQRLAQQGVPEVVH